MKIYFRKKKLQKACSSERASIRMWGRENAKKLHQRLRELEAADNLSVIYCLPAARCHQLKGNRTGQFAVNLKHPFRLIFEPRHDPVPLKDDGGIDLTQITEIIIVEVEDYHG